MRNKDIKNQDIDKPRAVTLLVSEWEYRLLQEIRFESAVQGNPISMSRILRDAIKHYIKNVDLEEKYLRMEGL